MAAGNSHAEPVDPALVREHEKSWHGFTNFVKWGTIIVFVILAFLFFFVA
jgi:hypothetical protein